MRCHDDSCEEGGFRKAGWLESMGVQLGGRKSDAWLIICDNRMVM